MIAAGYRPVMKFKAHASLLVLGLVVIISDPVLALETPVQVHVSIPPQKFLLERVGGKHVKVLVLLKQGLNPESYEPTPKQMAELSKSAFYFRIGVPFESVWIQQVSSLNPTLRIVSCCGDRIASGTHSHADKHNGRDTHVWTSPANAKWLAKIMLESLSNYAPHRRSDFEDNYRDLISDLDALDQTIRNNLSDLDHRFLIVSHPSWGHFADDYRLNQIAIERHGAELRARELVKLIKLMQEHSIGSVYVQPQYKTAAAMTLARETGAKIIEIDPLAGDYINNLREVSWSIKEGNTQ